MSSIAGKPKILVILGPTASGKSALGVKLARKYNGEIISADSRQVYKGLDIGSGKVPRDKITSHRSPATNYLHQGTPHHLLDVASPTRTFTVSHYQKLGRAAIKKILKNGKLPIIVGGTGFYIDALLSGMPLPEVKPNKKLRAQLEKKSAEELFQELIKKDPNRAATIEQKNKRRLIRALEIIRATGKPVPSLAHRSQHATQYDILKIGMKITPEKLKQKISARLRARLAHELIKEVKNLHKRGLSWRRLDELGLEYRYVSRYLRTLSHPSTLAQGREAKRLAKKEMIEMLERKIYHYAKRQMTWFKRDMGIHWVRNTKDAERHAKHFLQEKSRLKRRH